jgi:hypothetical protein
MAAAVVKTQVGAGDEIAYSAGDEDFATARQLRDAGRNVNGDAADLVPLDLNLASMEPGSHRDAEQPHSIDNAHSAAYGTSGTVERGEKAIPQGLDLATAKSREGGRVGEVGRCALSARKATGLR